MPKSPEKALRIVDHVSDQLFMTESADEKIKYPTPSIMIII